VNIAEFAQKIGVSTATVSYAINNKDAHISAATKQMVLARMKELGYRPSRLARAFATQKTRIIALWTHDVYPPYYTHAISHIRHLLKAEGFEFHIVEPAASGRSGDSTWPVEGIIAFHKGEAVQEMLDAGMNRGVPIVDMGVGCLTSIDHVRINTYNASVEAVEHLIAAGRRRIAYLLPGRVNEFDEERCIAYSKVMREAGLDAEFIRYDSPLDSLDRPKARERMKEYVAHSGCPDAIFGSDDESAIGAYKGLREAGIRIPDDAALIGCDGIADTEYLDPSLTTIVQPFQAMCETAWEFLRGRMADPDIRPQHHILDARLDIRGSSGI
jgi:LacI family transcriptional regulator